MGPEMVIRGWEKLMQIAPSLLSADFSALREAINLVAETADLLHIDVMDGRFVPNITVGPVVVESIRRHTDLPLDVHMMIVEPERYVDAFRQAGADILTVHYEACSHLQRVVAAIHETGALAGVALNPATPVEVLTDILSELDLVLVMSVNPGFGGQQFWPRAVDKVNRVRRMRGDRERPLIEVDGGINPNTAKLVKSAGADIVVAGSAIFGQPDPAAQVTRLHNL